MNLPHQQQSWGRQIVSFAARQGIRLRVNRAIRSSQVLAYCLEMYEPAQLSKLLRMEDALALALRADQVRLGRTAGEVTVEITLPESLFAPLALAALPLGQGPSLPLGRSILNQPVTLNLADPNTPHSLVAGTTGSGKSVLLQTIVSQLARQHRPDELGLLLIDGKHEGLTPFANLPHIVHPLITDPTQSAAALAWSVAELDRRKGAAAGVHRRLVIVVDEIAEILTPNGGVNGPTAQCVQRLAAVGRSMGIHLVLATQYPNADVLGGMIAKANLPARLAGHVIDASSSALATGVAGLAAQRLAGKGDFLLVAGGIVQRLQVAMPTDDDLRRLPRGAGGVLDLDLDGTSADGALRATAATAGTADPLLPEHIAWCLANSVPGIGAIKRELSIGSAKAGRLQTFAREIADALAAYGCSVYCDEEQTDG